MGEGAPLLRRDGRVDEGVAEQLARVLQRRRLAARRRHGVRQDLGYDGEVLQLGLGVGGAKEGQVVQEVGRSTIFGLRDLAHPRWIVGLCLDLGEVGGVRCGGVREDVEEEARRHGPEPPHQGVHRHHLLRLAPRVPQVAQPHHLLAEPSAPDAATHPFYLRDSDHSSTQ